MNSGDMSHAVDLLREQNKVLAGRLALTRGLVEVSMAKTERASDQTERAMALLEGMTTEAKRHAARAERLEADLARAHAHHMFGVDVDGPPADRVGALHYLRTHGLPEATPADLDAACEGLVTPWGSGPSSGLVEPGSPSIRCSGTRTWPSGMFCTGCQDCWCP